MKISVDRVGSEILRWKIVLVYFVYFGELRISHHMALDHKPCTFVNGVCRLYVNVETITLNAAF